MSRAQKKSRKLRERESGLLGDDTVAGEAELVHDGFHPMRRQVHRGFSLRVPTEEFSMACVVAGERRPRTAASVSVTPACRPDAVVYAAAPEPIESFAVVGQSLTACRPRSPFVGTFAFAQAPSFPSRAVGVPQSLTAIPSGIPAPFPFTLFAFNRWRRARKLDGSSK
jgi:hypothetical protein